MRLGLDCSNYQGALSPVQAQALRQEGIEFVYVLLTDGTGFYNTFAPGQCSALRNAGIEVGFYHFYRSNGTEADQILNFLNMAQSCGGSSLPLALDCEEPDPGGWADLATHIYAFARQIEGVVHGVSNTHSVFYVNQNFYDNLAPHGFPWGRWVWFADPSSPTQPSRPCLIWQRAPRPVPPLASVDPDYFLGTDADWAAFTLSQPPITPTQEKDDMAVPFVAAVSQAGPYFVIDGEFRNKVKLLEPADGTAVTTGLGYRVVYLSQAQLDSIPTVG